MYVPSAFRPTDQSRLHNLIEQYSFGLLLTPTDALPEVTHLPLLLVRNEGEHGTLYGHLARANPHADRLQGSQSLAVFSGPHVYISPSWYEAEQVVPTWNYVAVHASGPVEIIEEPAALFTLVERMTGYYEAHRSAPWPLVESPPIERMLNQIIGFRLPITSLIGKWKLSQNHPVERRRKVIAQLRSQPSGEAQKIADLMAKELS